VLGLLAVRGRRLVPGDDLPVVVRLRGRERQRVHVLGQRPDGDVELLELPGSHPDAGLGGPRDLRDGLGDLEVAARDRLGQGWTW
jgi:hypothetical protein